MQAVLPTVDRELLIELARQGSAGVQALCSALEVTATAVRQRLERLQAQKLVERSAVKVGRGRPKHEYKVTAAGHRELGDNYADLAQILWRQLQLIEDDTVRARIFEQIRSALVARYAADVDGETPRQRLHQLEDSLSRQGFHVEIDETGELPVLRENHCPYIDLASEDSSICDLEQQVYETLLGKRLELKQCCRDGETCCEFEMRD